MEEVKLFEDFINKVGKWLVFHWNENYYIVIDSEPKSYNLPVMDSQIYIGMIIQLIVNSFILSY
jgi:hypothetical protein